jgi:hypothetical protein
MTEATYVTTKSYSRWQFWHSAILALLVIVFVLLEVLAPVRLRLATWTGVMVLFTAFVLIAGHGVTGLWMGVLIDTRNKVSLSRLQMLAWTILILSAFLTGVVVNIDLEVADPLAIVIPPELWALMGISTASLVGSPLLVRLKQGRTNPAGDEARLQALVAQDQIRVQGEIVSNARPGQASLADMFRGSETGNIGLLDMGKVQMFFFTLVLTLAYALSLAEVLAIGSGPVTRLPVIDPGLLTLLGISHAGYLLNKALPKGGSM